MKKSQIKKIIEPIETEKGIKCEHNGIIKLNNYIYFCTICSNLSYIKISNKKINHKNLIKPIRYNIPLDFDPFLLIKRNNNLVYIENTNTFSFPKIYINFRKKLINIIKNLYIKFNPSKEVLFLSIFYLDSVLSTYNYNKEINQKKLLSLTVSCFNLAFKFVEICEYNTNVDYSFFSLKFNMNSDDFIFFEIECLKRLKYNLNCVYFYTYIQLFKYVGFVFQSEVEEKFDLDINEVYKYLENILYEIINDYSLFEKFTNKQIAYAIIYITRKKFLLDEELFNEQIIKNIYHYDFSLYKNCVVHIKNYLDDFNQNISYERNSIFSKNNEI